MPKFIADPATALYNPADGAESLFWFRPPKGVKALCIRARKGGSRRWVAKLLFAGKRHNVTVGSPDPDPRDGVRYLPTYTDASKVAHRLAALAERGHDPRGYGNLDLDKAAALARPGLTFGTAVTDYLARLEMQVQAGELSPRYHHNSTLLLAGNGSHVTGWNNRPIAEITWGDFLKVVATIKARNGERPVKNAVSMPGHGLITQLQLALGRVWRHVRKNQDGDRLPNIFEDRDAQGIVGQRDRVLSEEEVGKILRAAPGLGSAGEAIVFCLHVGSRHLETAHLPWSELTDDLTAWTLRPERANVKSDRVHSRPLPRQITKMLEEIRERERERERKSDFVFAMPYKNAPVRSLQPAQNELRKIIGVEDWSIHTLKHTGAFL
jgi:integrase